jgi:hypothetical protein
MFTFAKRLFAVAVLPAVVTFSMAAPHVPAQRRPVARNVPAARPAVARPSAGASSRPVPGRTSKTPGGIPGRKPPTPIGGKKGDGHRHPGDHDWDHHRHHHHDHDRHLHHHHHHRDHDWRHHRWHAWHNHYWWRYSSFWANTGYAPGIAPATLTAAPAYNPEPYPAGGDLGVRDVADLIRADNEAKLTREYLRQERRRFDDEKVERAPRPPSRPGRISAASTEIWSGGALNELLDELGPVLARDDAGAGVALDPALLEQINVAPPRGGNIGLLKNGHVDWPQVLRGTKYQADRAELDKLVREAVEQAKGDGYVDPALLTALARAAAELEAKLKKALPGVPPADYIAAKRFLRHLDEALVALKQSDAGSYFDRTYTAKGRTVTQLVRNMADQNLRFAPATPGTEQAYLKLYRAMLASARLAQSETTVE